MKFKPKVVVCGSFHRDLGSLKKLILELETNGCRVLSPLSVDFDEDNYDFVKTKTESSYSVKELEGFHLRAIRDADFVWLHAPGGYVGLSASFELGFAYALKKPIFCQTLPEDILLREIALKQSSVFEQLFQWQTA